MQFTNYQVNGVYEILLENTQTSLNDPKQVYENSRWIITIEMKPNYENEYLQPGILTIRSKTQDGSSTIEIVRECGT